MTPSEVADSMQPVAAISVPSPVSWADEERDITAWLGNELQSAAFDKLYELAEKVENCHYDQLKKDWNYLQSSDHFYYMCTKFFSDGAVHAYFNPYDTPYDAFMNYMNVLSDFEIRINRMCHVSDEELQILKLSSELKAKNELIKKQGLEIDGLTKKLEKSKPKKKITRAKPAVKTAEKKAVVKTMLKETSGTRSLAQLAAEAFAKVKIPAKKSAKAAVKKPAAKKTRGCIGKSSAPGS
jgi:alpha-amylase